MHGFLLHQIFFLITEEIASCFPCIFFFSSGQKNSLPGQYSKGHGVYSKLTREHWPRPASDFLWYSRSIIGDTANIWRRYVGEKKTCKMLHMRAYIHLFACICVHLISVRPISLIWKHLLRNFVFVIPNVSFMCSNIVCKRRLVAAQLVVFRHQHLCLCYCDTCSSFFVLNT